MKRHQGFLLLEVILTLSILAAGLLTVTASFNVSKKMMNRSREFFRSTLFSQEKMFDVWLKDELFVSDPLSGEGWNVRILPVDKSDELLWVKTNVTGPETPGSELPFETLIWKKK